MRIFCNLECFIIELSSQDPIFTCMLDNWASAFLPLKVGIYKLMLLRGIYPSMGINSLRVSNWSVIRASSEGMRRTNARSLNRKSSFSAMHASPNEVQSSRVSLNTSPLFTCRCLPYKLNPVLWNSPKSRTNEQAVRQIVIPWPVGKPSRRQGVKTRSSHDRTEQE